MKEEIFDDIKRYKRQLIDFINKRKDITIEKLDGASLALGYKRPKLKEIPYCYSCRRRVVRHNINNAYFIGGGPILIENSDKVICHACLENIEEIEI